METKFTVVSHYLHTAKSVTGEEQKSYRWETSFLCREKAEAYTKLMRERSSAFDVALEVEKGEEE